MRSARFALLGAMSFGCSADEQLPDNEVARATAASSIELATIDCGPIEPIASPDGQNDLCTVKAGSSGLLLQGTVLGPDAVYRGGAVVVDGGRIACVGCDCAAAPEASVISCPEGVISPGLINTHDHMSFAHIGPVAHDARYDHRHDWRLGRDGHEPLRYETGDACEHDCADAGDTCVDGTCSDGSPCTQILACPGSGDACVGSHCERRPASDAHWTQQLGRELGFLTTGTTTTLGGTGWGLIRNLGENTEGLLTHFEEQTFPLGDFNAELIDGASCEDLDRPSYEHLYDAYVAHVAEGVTEAANQEAACLRAPASATHDNSTFIHAMALDAADALHIAERRTWVSWSPRSNISLYGMTAPITLLDTLGVGLTVGTDWAISGSNSLQRELACAGDLSQRMGRPFSAFRLWEMVTTNAALALGIERHVGLLRTNLLADIAVYWGDVHADHRAVIEATAADVALVLRDGKPLYGDVLLMSALGASDRKDCEPFNRCEPDPEAPLRPKLLCSDRTEPPLAPSYFLGTLDYDTITCGPPVGEPTCVPKRNDGPTTFDCASPDPGDADCDGVPDEADNCTGVWNPPRPMDANGAQPDADGDGLGDACDATPVSGTVLRDARDHDGDGIDNGTDNCPRDPNAAQIDSNDNGRGDACEVRAARDPNDPLHARAASEGVALSRMVVTEVVPPTALVLQRRSARPFGGIVISANPRGIKPNDTVAVSGALVDLFGTAVLVPQTPLAVDGHEDRAAAKMLVVIDNPARLARNGPGTLSAEAYESMLVRVEDVVVTDPNPHAPYDFDEFTVSRQLDPDDTLRVGSLLYPALGNDFPVGTGFAFLQGVLLELDGYKLEPRSARDLSER